MRRPLALQIGEEDELARSAKGGIRSRPSARPCRRGPRPWRSSRRSSLRSTARPSGTNVAARRGRRHGFPRSRAAGARRGPRHIGPRCRARRKPAPRRRPRCRSRRRQHRRRRPRRSHPCAIPRRRRARARARRSAPSLRAAAEAGRRLCTPSRAAGATSRGAPRRAAAFRPHPTYRSRTRPSCAGEDNPSAASHGRFSRTFQARDAAARGALAPGSRASHRRPRGCRYRVPPS